MDQKSNVLARHNVLHGVQLPIIHNIICCCERAAASGERFALHVGNLRTRSV